ncbi:TBC1 domain family member 5 [Anabrus simplex]|uniref:TBC1 domain family member 5 n=1 Tax=Anabrus simplex TaxID=316456 RepID=UPI0035A2B222
MTTQENDDCLKSDSENTQELSPQTLVGDSEFSERSPESVTDETSGDSSEKSASVQKYEEEWAQLYFREDPDLGELRRRAVLGYLRASRFRSVCWRALLGVFPPDTSEWLPELRKCRQHYSELLRELTIDPWDRNEPEDNPLSQNAESIWHQYFCDKELRAVIKQDVVRTFPGVDFFRKEMIQDAMVNILFCYAREHPTMCYRQGMHEILAPLLFVLHCDHQALLHTKEQVNVSSVIAEVLDPDYLEEDAYTLFSHIMEGIASCYRINDMTPTATGYFPPNLQSPTGNGSIVKRTENEVVAQLNWIRDELLAPSDRQLYDHLQQLDIPLPLFGIRWLRLLFGREFPLQDLLVLWDAIFAEGENFELVNYVVVAMLIAIRYQLLSGDYTTCLTYLMRYPGAVDITYIIEHALYLKDPMKYCQPAMTSFPHLPVVTVGGRSDLNRAGQPSSGKDVSVQQPTNRGDKQRKKSDSQGTSTLSGRFKKLSSRSNRWGSGKGNSRSSRRADGDAGIVDGYALDDPALLMAELQHAHAVMSLCHLKLAQYRTVLQHSIGTAENSEAQQALDGINELCSLLNSRRHVSSPPEIEPAYEAGEVRVERQQSASTHRSIPPPNQLLLHQGQDRIRRRDGAKIQVPGQGTSTPPPVPMKTFKEGIGVEGEKVEGAPVKDPLAAGKDFRDEQVE